MFVVQPSIIHGLGLFADHFIPAGTVLGVLEGNASNDDGEHVLWLDHERGMEVTNIFRYINHSDRPNAAYYDDLTVVAERDIWPGQEITHDYRGDLEHDVDFDTGAA